MRRSTAEIVREYGPFPGVDNVAGVTYDGDLAWLAAGTHLQSFDPATGELGRRLAVAADAGTAFDGRHLFQITAGVIQKIDAQSGQVLSTIPAPGKGGDSGLAWAEGALWVADFIDGEGKIIDATTWFRFNCGALSSPHARRRMVLESAVPLSPELIARIGRLHGFAGTRKRGAMVRLLELVAHRARGRVAATTARLLGRRRRP